MGPDVAVIKKLSHIPRSDVRDSNEDKKRGGEKLSVSTHCMRRGNVTREGKEVMHGIADPLTKLFLTIAAGGINTEASV